MSLLVTFSSPASTSSEEENSDFDINESIIDELLISQEAELSDEELIPISVEELVIAQPTNPFCVDVRSRLNRRAAFCAW